MATNQSPTLLLRCPEGRRSRAFTFPLQRKWAEPDWRQPGTRDVTQTEWETADQSSRLTLRLQPVRTPVNRGYRPTAIVRGVAELGQDAGLIGAADLARR